ncbi:unnamed protein product [Gongylonema pulchrum]|uniref:PAS domain-containing protein n=1 Tax=Gongylonema pulchrum TaxID=637853 RepID=A0A3P7PAG7_9BILA|nr:unnamed protein product [Gongylonema pulchrum]
MVKNTDFWLEQLMRVGIFQKVEAVANQPVSSRKASDFAPVTVAKESRHTPSLFSCVPPANINEISLVWCVGLHETTMFHNIVVHPCSSQGASIFAFIRFQTELTGRPLKEFVHSSDYDELIRFDTAGGSTASAACDRITTLRMKSVITPRGRNLNFKSALYKPVVCHMRSLVDASGQIRIRVMQASAQPAGQGSNAVVAARNVDVPNGTYMTRHTSDMKFSYVSENFNYIVCRESRSLMGTSFFNLVYPADLDAVVASIRELLAKGYTRTPYYRLIGANKTVLWVQTEATAINHTTKGHKGQYIICKHDLLGTQTESESFLDEKRCASRYSLTHVKEEVLTPLKEEENLGWSAGDEKRRSIAVDFSSATAQRIAPWNSFSCPKFDLFISICEIALFTSSILARTETCQTSSLVAPQSESRTSIMTRKMESLCTTEVACQRTAQSVHMQVTELQRANCEQTVHEQIIMAEQLMEVHAVVPLNAYVLSSSGAAGGGVQRNTGNMFTTLSTAGTQYARSIGYDLYPSNASDMNVTTLSYNSAQNNFALSPTSPVDLTATEITKINYNTANSDDG